MREHSFHSQNKPEGEFFFFSKDGTFFKVKTNRFPLSLLKQTRPNLIIHYQLEKRQMLSECHLTFFMLLKMKTKDLDKNQ